MINNKQRFTPLPETFYQQPTLPLAQALLGQVLVKNTDEGMTAGIIVETEAYLGAVDQAAHSFKNRRTKRTAIMFEKAGMVYTYSMHTHCLVNVVSGEIENPEAILIRALEPCCGIDLMQQRRPVKDIKSLTNGPGKLTKAMGIDMHDYGRSFLEPPLFIANGKTPIEIEAGPRIGIENSGKAKHYPYRFWIKGNPYISK
ncbi:MULTISPECIES: DNA-3-methyladenine glycosylase [unclassified Virgibacillus]|uniref:DNA-3-methyladenine glycosylase n=1 Tax=unclassified Virgibacillus TaxID=2620237 RepID=UPI0024DE2890|nr:DNA-3-methyladenine glycosylase [Virgibacillus sp. LDC-1]